MGGFTLLAKMSRELAKYIRKQMKGCAVKGIDIDGEWLYVKKPFTSDLEF
jgi:hypothetical protein